MSMTAGFAYVSRGVTQQIVTDKNIHLREMRLLLLLVGHMKRGNWLDMTPAEMARILGVSRSGIYTSLSSLVDCGYLHRAGHTYRIDPQFAWNGTAAERNAYIQELERRP